MEKYIDFSSHLAGIIPVAGEPVGFNMPWHDSLMPIAADYHAIERAVNSAAVAGCNTIWIVMRRDSSPIIKKKVGHWIYDPEKIWLNPYPYRNKREIPIYYIAIRPGDRKRRDSHAWSALYGSKVAAWVSKKISKWVAPKRYLVISPYGIIDEKVLKENRETFRGDKNVLFKSNDKTFLDNEYLPFTFNEHQYEICRDNYKSIYTGKDVNLNFSDIFSPIDISKYLHIDPGYYHNIDNWDGYRNFMCSPEGKACFRPKYMRVHKWFGWVEGR